jgi:hypothetical protein
MSQAVSMCLNVSQCVSMCLGVFQNPVSENIA